MMPEYSKYEADGWFYLASNGAALEPWDDTIGRGGCMKLTRFHSAEGREYFVQMEQARHAQNCAVYELDCLRSELAKAVKKRGVRKRILELIG